MYYDIWSPYPQGQMYVDIWTKASDGGTMWDNIIPVASVGEAFQIIDMLGLLPLA